MNIKINKLNTNYNVYGKGNNSLLILHGWGSNKEVFHNVIKNLNKSIKVYILDLPGFGKSQEPECAWDIEDYTNFIIKFISKLNITNLSIMGHSFGGRIMIRLANKNNLPFKINKYILVNSAGIKHISKNTNYKVKINKVLFKIVGLFSEKLVNNLKNKIGSTDYKNASLIMKQVLVKVINEDLKDEIKNINYPTLIIWGKYDTATPYDDALYMKSVIEDSGLITINGGHYSFLDDPLIVTSAINSFVGEKND